MIFDTLTISRRAQTREFVRFLTQKGAEKLAPSLHSRAWEFLISYFGPGFRPT